MFMRILSVSLAALVALATPAAATVFVPIPGLVNSGRLANDSAVTTGTVLEQNWLLGSTSPWNGTGINSAWLANNSTSRWMTPASNANQSFPAGTSLYSLSFDLTDFIPSTASFSGRFLVDNRVTALTLNGNPLLSIPVGGVGGFRAANWTSFSANSGFTAGLNTLQFTVLNAAGGGANPTGLRVEFTGSAVNAVPEPASWAMLIAGFGLVGAMARRRAARQRAVLA
jgi:hypothetical protein